MIYDARTWQPTQNHHVYLDANAWIYAFNPFDGQKPELVEKYSELLKQLISHNCKIYYDSLVISEVVNTCLRISYELYLDENTLDRKNYKFKMYRETDDFRDVIETMGAYLKFLYRIANPLYRTQNLCNYDTIINKFVSSPSDINDIIISHTCNNLGILIITQDADMAVTGADILTFNRRLLVL